MTLSFSRFPALGCAARGILCDPYRQWPAWDTPYPNYPESLIHPYSVFQKAFPLNSNAVDRHFLELEKLRTPCLPPDLQYRYVSVGAAGEQSKPIVAGRPLDLID